MNIGRRIYYDVKTGNVIVDLGERQGFIIETTVEQDIESIKILSELNRNSFDYIQLDVGQYVQDFAECNGYRVNPETKKLEFSYPDPNNSQPQEPVYQKPLSDQINDIRLEQAQANSELVELMMNMIGGIS